MLSASMRKEVLTAVITAAITTVIFTPITLFLAYKLNDYWSKDKISIARVDLVPETTKLFYPSNKIMELEQNSRFKNYLTSRGSSIYQFNPGFYNNQLRKFLTKKDINEIRIVLEDFSKFDEELKVREDTAIQQLKNYSKGSNILNIFSTINHPRLIYRQLVGENDEEVAKRLLDFLKNDQSSIEAANQYKIDILKTLEDFKPERIGRVEIKTTLLNSGDTDGLVKQDGKLYIGDRKEPIYITEKKRRDDENSIIDIPEQFQSVPKRSMVQKVYIINESGTASGILNVFKDMIIKGDRSSFKIVLDDIRDDPIHSDSFHLPIN
jgi:hypothetical protein